MSAQGGARRACTVNANDIEDQANLSITLLFWKQCHRQSHEHIAMTSVECGVSER
jgi:hypothetical protein